jgi:DNA polymerase-3 subunit alpha
LEEYREVSEGLNSPKTVELYDYVESGKEGVIDNKKVQFVGIINSIKKKVTKRDEIMAFCGIEDLYGDIEMIVFPKVLAEFSAELTVGNIVLVDGKISVKDDEIKLLAEKIAPSPKSLKELGIDIQSSEKTNSKQRKGLFLRLNKRDEKVIVSIKNLLSIFEGKTPVYLYFEDSKQYEFLGNDYLTSVNAPMIKELKLKIGENNVVLRE